MWLIAIFYEALVTIILYIIILKLSFGHKSIIQMYDSLGCNLPQKFISAMLLVSSMNTTIFLFSSFVYSLKSQYTNLHSTSKLHKLWIFKLKYFLDSNIHPALIQQISGYCCTLQVDSPHLFDIIQYHKLHAPLVNTLHYCKGNVLTWNRTDTCSYIRLFRKTLIS